MTLNRAEAKCQHVFVKQLKWSQLVGDTEDKLQRQTWSQQSSRACWRTEFGFGFKKEPVLVPVKERDGISAEHTGATSCKDAKHFEPAVKKQRGSLTSGLWQIYVFLYNCFYPKLTVCHKGPWGTWSKTNEDVFLWDPDKDCFPAFSTHPSVKLSRIQQLVVDDLVLKHEEKSLALHSVTTLFQFYFRVQFV